MGASRRGDTAPDDALVDFARDTDLLMLEATLEPPERESPRGHMTAAEAGDHAAATAPAARADPSATSWTGSWRLARRAAFGGA